MNFCLKQLPFQFQFKLDLFAACASLIYQLFIKYIKLFCKKDEVFFCDVFKGWVVFICF